jgi:excisionase family DNA binding protein
MIARSVFLDARFVNVQHGPSEAINDARRISMTEKLLLTVGEAADRLGVGRSFLYQLLQRGELQSLKLGRARRVPLRALDEFVDKRLKDDLEMVGVR